MRAPIIVVMFLSLVQLSTALQPQITGGASLGGIVVRAGTGEPLSGAQVILTEVTGGTSRGSSKIPPLVTGADGKFVFQNLEAGLYRLQVSRDAYSRQTYGQSVPDGPAPGIRLSAGQSLNGVVMALVPAGIVRGVIRDKDGHPLAGVTIQILRVSYDVDGQKTLLVEGSRITDDLGQYRLFWISPGRYYVSASSSSNPRQSFALTYFPGVLDVDAASIVEVSAGSETSGIDFVAVSR